MAIEMTGVVPRHERRLRLVFSDTLGAGAFGAPAPPYYVVENQDGKGPSPNVRAAIIVAGATTNVELALDADLVPGALYRVTAIGVPASDASTSTSASDELFRVGAPARTPNVEPKTSDIDLLRFGRDIVWTGDDYGETAEGDMATTEGLPNAKAAFERRMLGAPLAWAPEYSARARQYVDIPSVAIGTLQARFQEQALRDRRIESVTATFILDEDAPGDGVFELTPVFLGGRNVESVRIERPTR